MVRSGAAAAPASASWSARARRSIDSASAVWPVSFSSQPSRLLQNASADRTAADGTGPAGPASRCSASRYAASASSALPVNSSSRPMAVRLRPMSALARSPDPGSAARASRAASTLRCAGSASSGRPTRRVSAATSKFALVSASREAVSDSRPKERPQLAAVEVGGRPGAAGRAARLNWSSFSRKSSLTPVVETFLRPRRQGHSGPWTASSGARQPVPSLPRRGPCSRPGLAGRRARARPWPGSERSRRPPDRRPMRTARPPRPSPSSDSACPSDATGGRMALARPRLARQPPSARCPPPILGTKRSDPRACWPSPSDKQPPGHDQSWVRHCGAKRMSFPHLGQDSGS